MFAFSIADLTALAADPVVWASLATLIAMEIVLGIDNLIFISIVTNRLPVERRESARRIGIGILEKRAADFLEGKESMALVAVVYESGFEAGFNAGDDTLVDIALALLFSGCFYIEVDELLAIDDRDTQFFRLGRVKQHALHFLFSRAHFFTGRTNLAAPLWREAFTGFPSSDNSWVEEDDSYL